MLVICDPQAPGSDDVRRKHTLSSNRKLCSGEPLSWGMRFAAFLLAETLANAGQFTTSLGDTYPYTISAIATDTAGNTYVTGSRQLTTPLSAQTDVFVTKLDPSGNLLFTRVFGGSASSSGGAIAVDATGNIYIAGNTMASDFPLSNALQTLPNGAFIMKLSNDGRTILYSTYFGGTLGGMSIASLATDANGNLYLTGQSDASDFPHTSQMPLGPLQNGPSQITIGAFITSISAAGDKILYSGAIVGTAPASCGMERGVPFCEVDTYGYGITVDSAGNAYVVGVTGATNLPITIGVLGPTGSGEFAAKINAGGQGLSYLTYLNASISTGTSGSLIAVDAAGNAYIGEQAAVAKIKPDASAIVWQTSVGNLVQSIALDGSGGVWATGLSYPNLIANTNGWTTGTEFLVRFDAAGTLTYSALYPAGTIAQSVALDPSGFVHVAGANGFVSAIAPSGAPAMSIFGFQNAFGGNITARVSPAEVISIYGPGIGPASAASVTPTNGFYPTTFSGVQVTMNGLNIPLLYVSPNQINAVVPMEAAIGAGAAVRVINGTAVSPAYPVWIVPAAPQAFPTVLNQNGTINSQTNPTHSGGAITFYATGWQSTFFQLADGQVATSALAVFSGNCCVTIQGVASASVLYAGDAPGIVAGVSQFNIQLGAVSAVGQVPFSVNYIASAVYQVNESVWVAP
jgi:uncharacterized protein (TIGR03437 family)